MKTPKLSTPKIQIALKKIRGWSLNSKGEITRTFKLEGFPQSLLFTNAVGFLAEAADHHPDFLIQWNKVTLSLSTHDSGGLTRKDFELAGKISALPGVSG